MKSSLFYLIFGSLLVTIILQSIMFMSTGLKLGRIEKQLGETTQKINTLQESQTSINNFIRNLNAFIEEPLPVATPSLSDPNDLLSPDNLNKTFSE